jgi:hypothetical protein
VVSSFVHSVGYSAHKHTINTFYQLSSRKIIR